MNINVNEIEGRACTKHDALAHFEAIESSYSEVSTFIPWVARMANWTLDDHEKYLDEMRWGSSVLKNYLFYYEGKVIGAGHLKPTLWDHSAEISYWVRSGYDGMGIGLHIAKTMASYAYSNLGFLHVVIRTDRNNIGSRKVAEKLGAKCQLIYGYFDHFGKVCNMLVWSIPSPRAKLAAKFDSSYEFNPIARDSGFNYRTDTNEMLQRYATPDIGLLRA